MTAWPSVLPEAEMPSYGYERRDIAIRTEMDTGRTRMRQRFSDGPATVNLTWKMTHFQMAYFEGWWLNIIAAGTLPFTTKIKIGSGWIDHECRFLKPYTASVLGDDIFQVSAPVEATQLEVWSAEFLALVDAYGDNPEELAAFLDLFDIFVNIDLPASEMGA